MEYCILYCRNRSLCNHNQSPDSFSARIFDFITYDEVVTAEGYPQTHDTNPDAMWTMLVIQVPDTTDLCVNGATRRRRDADLFLNRHRRADELGNVCRITCAVGVGVWCVGLGR